MKTALLAAAVLTEPSLAVGIIAFLTFTAGWRTLAHRRDVRVRGAEVRVRI